MNYLLAQKNRELLSAAESSLDPGSSQSADTDPPKVLPLASDED